MSTKKEVNGIILILSCQKHKYTRLKEINLKNTSYANWEVVHVIGDFFLDANYKYENNETTNGKNYLYIRCEDSYLHLLKKLALSIKAVYEIFNIKEGVLRCGDDLYFNEKNLVTFLNSRKYDYYGQSRKSDSYKCVNKNDLRKRGRDFFMAKYYEKHPEDFLNPHHNLKGIDVSMYSLRPNIYGAAGVCFFLSNKACAIFVNHMEKINFNILHHDRFTNSYPYVIEDCGIAFIMYMNNIVYIDNQAFIYKGNEYQRNIDDFMKSNTIVMHTNRYK
jgi:hypothetical protein